MSSLSHFLQSRATVITLLALMLCAITVGALVPQRFITEAPRMQAWAEAHPALVPVAQSLGLHHLYTTPGFALLLFVCMLSLTLSAVRQCRGAWRRTIAGGAASGSAVRCDLRRGEVICRLRRLGYLPIGEPGRLVRHPWGYWGNALLHLGMVLAIAASLLIALTQQRGMVRLAEGEVLRPGDRWLSAEQGLAAGGLVLPEAVRLDAVSPTFHPSYALKSLASTLSFLPEGGTPEGGIVEINGILPRKGISIYQGSAHGHAFFVEAASAGTHTVYRLPIEHPGRPADPSYNDFDLGQGTVLRTKYFVDAGKSSFDSGNPLLVLRLDRGGKDLGHLPLTAGGEGEIAGTRFKLLAVKRWSQLIFVRLTGIAAVFAGFALLLVGGALHYFAVPREVWVREENDGALVTWNVARFNGLYAEEPALLAEALKSENRIDG